MNSAGRPLRFVALVMAGWVAARVAWMLPDAAMGTVPAVLPAAMTLAGLSAARIAAPASPAEPVDGRVSMVIAPPASRVAIALASTHSRRGDGVRAPRAVALDPTELPRPVVRGFEQAANLALIGLGSLALPQTVSATSQGTVAGDTAPPLRGANRLSASAWLLARSGQAPPSLAGAGQLGGSQFGVRLVYRIAGRPDAPVSVFGRLSGPLAQSGREASVGVEAQPFAKIPVRLLVERRLALEDGARSGMAIAAVGGGSVALPRGLQLDGYGQVGVVGLKRRDAFVDGAAVITAEAARLRSVPIRVGAGIWGGAQPGVSRLDIGPRVEAGVPMAGQTLRVGLDWRERVAGNAMPGSGPALTVGADF